MNGIYTTSASTEYSTTTYGVWQCFGNNVSNSWASKPNYSSGIPYSGSASTTIVGVGNVLGEWCQILFPYSFILTKWNVTTTTGGASGRVVYLLGSNDGTTWNQLDYYSTDGSSDTHLATLSNSTSYSYYRYVGNVSGATYVMAKMTLWK